MYNFKLDDVVILISPPRGHSKYRGEHAIVLCYDTMHCLYEIQMHFDAMIILVSETDIILASNMTSSNNKGSHNTPTTIDIDGKSYTLDEIRLIIKKVKCYDGDYT